MLEEPEAGPRHDRGDQLGRRRHPGGRPERVDEEARSGDRGDADGEPVQAVDQVHRVDDGDRPEHGDHGGEVTGEREHADTGQPEVEDLHAAEDEHAGGEQLACELGRRAHAADVVDHADDDQDGRRTQDPGGFGGFPEQLAEVGQHPRDRERCDERGEHRQTAHPRSWLAVHLPVVGDIDGADARGQRANERRDGE